MSDVCLVLEGTYPYVAGGVSTWIHQLVSAMSDIRFSILLISTCRNPGREYKYEVPPNVLDIQDIYLHEDRSGGGLSEPGRRRRAFDEIARAHEALLQGRWEDFKRLLPFFHDPSQALSIRDIFESEESWEILLEFYRRHGEEVSFVDFFWTWRAIYLPLVNLTRAPIPKARLYHTVSTGYAGLVAAIARITQHKRMLLTEHGIYTHERMLEISQADWIYTPPKTRFKIQRKLSFFKRFWVGLFNVLGGIAYHHADKIITLYEGNRTKEILAGADPEKISLIPNGVDLESTRDRRRERGDGKLTVAFIGRVVQIKDVKTYLRAAKIVLEKLPKVDFLILGPTDEDPEYTAECRKLIESLGIGGGVRFLGRVNVREYYPQLDVVALTSLSEAQPYVIIEANAAGVPIVATDVGACREMLEGRLPEDRVLGPSGILTGVADAEATAAGILRLLRDERLWRACAEAGRQRVFRYYDQNDLISQYLNLYEKNMS